MANLIYSGMKGLYNLYQGLTSTGSYDGIKTIARPLYPSAQVEWQNDRIFLKLNTEATISYSHEIDKIVQNLTPDSPVIEKLKFAFKKFELKLTTTKKLEEKVSKIVEKSLLPLRENKKMSKEESIEDIFSKTKNFLI